MTTPAALTVTTDRDEAKARTPVEEQSVFELFGGPGGMSEGMRLAGIPSALTVGWDNSKDACETAEKHGHRRIWIAALAQGDTAQTGGE